MGLIAGGVSAPYVHEGLLLVIALVLAAIGILGGLLLIRRAPAVGIALFAAVAAGTMGFFVSAANGPKGVPADVAQWASAGLLLAGVFGATTTKARPPSSFLWHAAVVCAIVAPFGALLIFLLVQQACPLYVTRGSGYCFYDFDMLGAWASGVAFLVGLDGLVLMTLFAVSGQQAKRREAITLGDDEWARLYRLH
jgi:hypothetical protein